MEIKNSVGYIISNTGRKLSQSLQQRFQHSDVTPEQWSLLITLDGKDGISHKELAQRAEKDPANITRLVDQLEKKSLVRRAPHPNDRRSLLLHLTELGRSTAHALAPIEAAYVGQIVSGLSPEEIQAFMQFMGKINRNIENA
ncbi:MarR family winged helix-turn-helix transcriptional regulator [Paenibacillus harenae]|uniref:MarR family transcriptional regulator for hemolysin n=1 Tax=Paenibacillus harenae TaxID=306543 RepID=A0ABT9TUN3_PAEHA|nr:MarR family transcriptional regulator [Paenibacillus harenae]MDQ0111075.1 MarR family transcriptional regulator for hemolysin [Paenibacillus harenae]